MTLSRLEYLFTRYVDQECNPEELAELMQLLADSENETEVKKIIGKLSETALPVRQMPDNVSDSILKNILQADKTIVVPLISSKNNFIRWSRVAVAAAIIFFLAGVGYWFVNQKPVIKEPLVAKTTPMIMPGGKKAILTIADGSTISLDNKENGELLQQGNTVIYKKDGLLMYNANAKPGVAVPPMYNTLSTPRGGQYELMLPDGSIVWLNAASQIRFPTSFTGNQREVEIEGEAYFEVAKNKKKPFIVNVDGMRVEVLGTTFNVNAYAEEGNIVTSLLEGSVKVSKGSLKDLLKPGQQATLNKKKEKIKVARADMDGVIAWKNGLFQFQGADIATIMRQVGRWYDVEVNFAGKIPVRQFEGKISRQANLTEVLQILELSNIKCSIEGNKIIVH
jgi:transmembrane sensor